MNQIQKQKLQQEIERLKYYLEAKWVIAVAIVAFIAGIAIGIFIMYQAVPCGHYP